jgi:hypothetical protein
MIAAKPSLLSLKLPELSPEAPAALSAATSADEVLLLVAWFAASDGVASDVSTLDGVDDMVDEALAVTGMMMTFLLKVDTGSNDIRVTVSELLDMISDGDRTAVEVALAVDETVDPAVFVETAINTD